MAAEFLDPLEGLLETALLPLQHTLVSQPAVAASHDAVSTFAGHTADSVSMTVIRCYKLVKSQNQRLCGEP